MSGMHIFMGVSTQKNVCPWFQPRKKYSISNLVSDGYNWSERKEILRVPVSMNLKSIFVPNRYGFSAIVIKFFRNAKYPYKNWGIEKQPM